MRERILNELMAMVSQHIDDPELLTKLRNGGESILSHYDVNEAVEGYSMKDAEEKHQWINEYIVCRKIGGLSEKTLALYRIVLTHFADSVNKSFAGISAFDIRNYLRTYQEQTSISNRTLDSRRTIICGFFT